MMNQDNSIIDEESAIALKIITIRDEKVILDVHLAVLYEIETRALKQAVRRNKYRFPDDFMYELTDDEINTVVSQNVIPSKKYLGGAVPFAFTENGVAMLSSVLNSRKAIDVNITIMRTFTMLRKILHVEKDVMNEIENMKKVISIQDSNIQQIFQYLNQLEQAKQKEIEHRARNPIGYKRKGDQ